MSSVSTPASSRSSYRRGWRQSFTAAVWGSSTSTSSDAHDVDMKSPSGLIPTGVCKKEYMGKLVEVVKGIVNARRSYLNNADENWQNFLDNVETAHTFFFGKQPNRMYRDGFTIENYRMLFQREASCYRDDVCRGVKRIRDGMWVNGDEVHFPQSLQDLGYELADRGEKLMDVVYGLEDNGVHRIMEMKSLSENRTQAIKKLKQAIKSFESKYTLFEQHYIEALISVEKRSRNLVQTVAEKIAEAVDERGAIEMDQALLDNIAELNKKSRDCFNCRYDVKVLQACQDESYYQARIHRKLWYLPKELVSTFTDVCEFLQELLPKILRVHPKLEHNPGLVARLEKFHEAYNRVSQWLNIGTEDFQNPPISKFCEYLDIALGCDSANALDNDVENILAIPRLFCLFTWANREEIERNAQSGITKFVNELYPDLLLELATIFSKMPASVEEADYVKLLVEFGMDSDCPSDLAKNLEVVSMQLQRKNATAWNSFVGVILHMDCDEEEERLRPRLPSV